MGCQESKSRGAYSASPPLSAGGKLNSDDDSLLLLPTEIKGAVMDIRMYTPSWIACGGEDGAIVLSQLLPSPPSPPPSAPLPNVKLLGHSKSVTCLHVSPTSGLLYASSRDCSVSCWSPSSPSSPRAKFDGHTLTVMSVCGSPDGSLLASGGRDYAIKLWDAGTCQCVGSGKISRNLVTSMKWFRGPAGGNTFAQGSEDLMLRLWDVRVISPTSAQANCATSMGKYIYFPLDVDVSASNTHLLTGSKGFSHSNGCEVRQWDIRKPSAPTHQLFQHSMDCVSVTYLSPELATTLSFAGPLVASASKDGSIRIWDLGGAAGSECVCVHFQNGAGMWTAIAEYGREGEGLFEGPRGEGGGDSKGAEALWGVRGVPHLLASSFFGGVYLFRIQDVEEGGLKLVCVNCISPTGNAESMTADGDD